MPKEYSIHDLMPKGPCAGQLLGDLLLDEPRYMVWMASNRFITMDWDLLERIGDLVRQGTTAKAIYPDKHPFNQGTTTGRIRLDTNNCLSTLNDLITDEESKMSSKQVLSNVKDETIDNAKLQIGRVVYTNVAGFVTPYLPKLKWYEKLFVSKEKREVATMVAVYFMLHLVRSRYDHYAFDALTSYLNHELQSRVINGLSLTEMHKLIALPVRVKQDDTDTQTRL